MLRIEQGYGLVTVQDLGWPTGRAIGLPQSGALDPPALLVANALVGNESTRAALEVIGGRVTSHLADRRCVAVTGGGRVWIDDVERPPWTALEVEAGSVMTIATGGAERVGYLAIAGGIDLPETLGSRSTYLPTGMGGLEGRRLKRGDLLPIGPDPATARPGTTATPPGWYAPAPFRVVAGPQAHLFDNETHRQFENIRFTVSPTSDRMGTRLMGPSVSPRAKAVLPSEATCPGAIQVPDDGQPIVILADGPTVGGYPKIGAIISPDLGRFAQLGPGAMLEFEWIAINEAERLRLEWWSRVKELVNESRLGPR